LRQSWTKARNATSAINGLRRYLRERRADRFEFIVDDGGVSAGLIGAVQH
jgi:hypothetical protein